MPHYWTNCPVTLAADATIHAGITRLWLQDNLRAVAENSGYSVDITMRDMPASEGVNCTWEWLDILPPWPIPIWRTHGAAGWRSYTFSLLAESDTANDILVRVFLLGERAHPLIDAATGDVTVRGGVTAAYKEITITSVLGRRDGDVTIDLADSDTARSVLLDQAWVHVAAYEPTAPGGDNLKLHSLHVQEGA